jgi:outer membrane protein assembly factor BamB
MRRLAGGSIVILVLVAGCAGASHQMRVHTSPPRAGGTGSGAAAAAAAAHRSTSWPTYHRTGGRSGTVGQPIAPPLHRAWARHLDGAVYGEPLVVGGTVVAATENDTVYGLNPRSGHVRWHTHLGTPASQSDIQHDQPGCGDIFPLGITGTPAYDAKTGSVFVVAETLGGLHTLWALNAKSGHRRWHRTTDVLPHRDRRAEQERSALLVDHGRVLTTYGGLSGDCGNYVGYVTSTSTTGKGKTRHYAVPTAREAGMWSPAGPVTGANGNVYVASGNGAEVNGKWDKSDSVTELTPASLHRVGVFAPSVWRSDNANDRDLGSSSPVPVPAAHRLVIAGKNGNVYLLRTSLGGVGGNLRSLGGCDAFGGAAVRGHTVVMPCMGGIRALSVGHRSLHWRWTASGIYGSAVIAGHRVFVANRDDGTLRVLSLKNGHQVGSASVGSLTHFPSESVAGNRIFVPTTSGITAVRGS